MMDKTLFLCGLAAAYIVYRSMPQGEEGDQAESIFDTAQTTLDETMQTISDAISGPGPIDSMTTSQSMLDMLKAREALKLTRYNLGDGGYTWGYGHFSTNPNALPITITRDQAEAIFAADVRDRGEKWVKLYVSIPLAQNQFDALVSIAFNMSPQSFRKFADSVNSGQGIDGIAQTSVNWVASNLRNGIQNRRDAEMAVFNYGVYA